MSLTVDSMKQKLDATPLITQLPLGCGRDFKGVIDLLSMDVLLWSSDPDDDGAEFRRVPLLGVSEAGEKDYGSLHSLPEKEGFFSGLLSKDDLKSALNYRKFLAEQVRLFHF